VTELPRGFATQVATLGPIGAVPFAPGTLGAAVGIALVMLIERLPMDPQGARAATGGLAAAIYVVGLWCADRAEEAMGQLDPGPVVIDEVAGQVIAFLIQPASGWKSLLGGFLLFRFFDVLKPFPARRLEQLRGGWGIMTDDVVAGVYAGLALFFVGFAVR
jgi:phosphatidylglycerophosphatase A